MSSYEPWQMRMAWQIALQARGCPPDSILRGGKADQRLRAHRAQCPFCSEHETVEAGLFEGIALAREPARRVEVEPREDRSPGTICRVSAALAGWGPRERYYNPPLVLVLEYPRDMPGAVRVAQVYDDPCLAGPGDVPLEEGLFAESWNTYALRIEDLESAFGFVDETKLREVLNAQATDPPSPEEGTILDAFRRLEVEVAAFFALQALSDLMDRRELGPLERIAALFPDGESLKRALAEEEPGIRWPEEVADPRVMLAHARLAKERLPMAAAGEEEWISANMAVLDGEVLRLEAVFCEIRHFSLQGNALVVGGKVLPPPTGRTEITGRWVKEGLPPRDCDQSFLDEETGYFRLLFRDMTEAELKSGRLLLLVAGFAG